jgi:hypothetical protein
MDRFLADFDFNEVHSIHIDAPQALVYDPLSPPI